MATIRSPSFPPPLGGGAEKNDNEYLFNYGEKIYMELGESNLSSTNIKNDKSTHLFLYSICIIEKCENGIHVITPHV